MRTSRLACWLLVGILGLPATAWADSVPRITIDAVRLGFSAVPRPGVFKAGAWCPISIDVTAGPDRLGPADAVVIVETSDTDEVQNRVTTPLPALDPKEARTLLTYFRPGATGCDLVITIQGTDGRVLATSKQNTLTYDAVSPGHVVYLVAGPKLPALKYMLSTLGKQQQPQVKKEDEDDNEGGEAGFHRLAHVTAVQQLPTRWYGYGTVDLMILPTGNEAFVRELLEDQQNRKEALAEWVHRGGRLVISTSRNQQFVAQLLARMRLIACDITGTVQRDSLDSVRQWAGSGESFRPRPDAPSKIIEIAKLEPHQDVQILVPQRRDLGAGQAEPPVIVQAPCGLGRVLLVAFDLDQPPFTTWPGRTDFWKKLNAEMAPKPPPTPNQNAMMGGSGWGGDYNEIGTHFRNRLETFPEVPVISFGWVALFILLYIIVVGPLDYLFLKKVVKRLELTWVTFPVVVIVVSAAAYFTAYTIKGNDLRINKVDLVDIDLHQGQTQGHTWFTLFSPRIQHYTVGVEPASPNWAPAPADKNEHSTVVSWLGRLDSGDGRYGRRGSQSLFRRAYDYAPDATGLQGVPIQVWSTKSFTASWEAPLGANQPLLTANLTPSTTDPTWISGKVINNLPVGLQEVTLFYQGQHYPVDAVPPGGDFRVDDLQKKKVLEPWFTTPFQARPMQVKAGGQVQNVPSEPISGLMKTLLFHQAEPNPRWHNSGFRELDQGWRLDKRNTNEAILCARVAPLEGPAEQVTQDGVSPSRLWLGQLPGMGQRPALAGILTQETYVRVFIPVNRGP